MIGTHAPLVNFVTATIRSTTSVATAPTPLSTALRCHPAPAAGDGGAPCPNCDSVNEVNTPTAYSGISALVRPPNATSSAAAAAASTMIPFENTSRSPRFASWRGR